MNEKTIEKPIINFQFVFSINQKAIYDYLISIDLTENELNYTDVVLVSYFVYLTNANQTKNKIIENEKYYFVQNSFLKTNLIFLTAGKKTISDRQINNRLGKLESLGMILRNQESKGERYLKVNSFLINNWNVNDLKGVTASQRLKKYKPEQWNHIENEFGKSKSFEKWITNFDYHPNRNLKDKLQKIAEELFDYVRTSYNNEIQKR